MNHGFDYVDLRSTTGAERLLSITKVDGVVPRDTITDRPARADTLIGYKKCRAGDLVVNQMSAYDGLMGVSPLDGIVTYHYLVFRPNGHFDSRFAAHTLRSDVYRQDFSKRVRGLGDSDQKGVRTPHIRIEDMLHTTLPYPPLEEQRAIANFLDVETARIDALIDKKRRLITLLTERFEAEIRHRIHTLTFPVLPLKRFWTVTDCKHRTPEYVESGYPVVSPGDATPGRLDVARCHRFVTEEDYRDLAAPPRRPERGSIIYSRNASIGIASYVDTEEPFCMGQDVCLITSTTQNQLFLTYVLNSTGVDQLEAEKIGSTFSRINVSQILDLRVPTPPVDVQRELAEEWDEKSSTIETAANRLTQQTALLEEKRRALITAAVTGEFAVPGTSAA